MNLTAIKRPNVVIASSFIGLWLIAFIYILISTHSPGPDGDDWDFIYFTEKIDAGTYSFNEWTEQFYGAHRLVIPKILFYLEYKFFHGKGIFTAGLGVFFLCCSFFIVAKNILETDLEINSRLFLLIIGAMLVFNPAQIPIINSQSHSVIRTPIIFMALLASHFMAHQYRHKKCLSPPIIFASILLACGALLFDLFGIFILATTLVLIFIIKTPLWLRITCALIGLLVIYYSLPGKIIIHTNTGTIAFTEKEAYPLFHIIKKPFFPWFFVFLFGYLGVFLTPISHVSGIILGLFIFLSCIAIFIFNIIKRDTKYLFFLLVLFILFIHAIGAGLGRYQDSGTGAFVRYYIFYCWIIWMLSICIIQFNFKRKVLCYISLILILLYSSFKQTIDQYSNYIDIQKATINIVNGSFYHETYNVIAFPHVFLQDNPIVKYDSYLRERNWGIYSNEISPSSPMNILSNDQCEAKKLHQFVVSEKTFYELKFDAWNITKNHYMNYMYAIDNSGKVIATGRAMPRSVSVLPLYLLPRDMLQIYMIIPRSEPLDKLTFLGGDIKSLCKIQMEYTKTNNPPEV